VRSRLLTSKPNYQCIVDGNNSQLGLSYPDRLLTTVISKPKRHSAAERRRRDRLKNALQRMSELLLQDSSASGADDKTGNSEGEGRDSTGSKRGGDGNQTVSKASTVEMAIEYIKRLQKELIELNSKLER
jgi:hypothetical protein